MTLPNALNPACNIKGNVSLNTGERIHHVPDQEYYGRRLEGMGLCLALRQLPDFEALEDAGLLSKEKLLAGGIPAGLANGDGEGDVVEGQVP